MREATKFDLEESLEKDVEEYKKLVNSRVRKAGLARVTKPEIPESLLVFDGDVTELSDKELGNRYFAAQQMCIYASSCATLADVEMFYANVMKEDAYARSILLSEGKSAEDRKAEAQRAPLHKAWNMVYLQKRGIFKILQTSAQSYERLADSFSREMTRRRVALEQTQKGV